MLFTPDTTDVLAFTVDLVNSAPGASKSGTDELPDPAALTVLTDRHRYSGRFDRDEAELRDVIAVRGRIRHAWDLPRDDLVAEINLMLREASALPQLERHDGLDWHLHAVPFEAPLAERMRVEIALALSDVVRADATDRMRVCSADDCDGVLVDSSRNGSKRFCSVRCGNRMNMVAFRERQAAG